MKALIFSTVLAAILSACTSVGIQRSTSSYAVIYDDPLLLSSMAYIDSLANSHCAKYDSTAKFQSREINIMSSNVYYYKCEKNSQNTSSIPKNYPPCPEKFSQWTWSQCFGTFVNQKGIKYVGDWVDGRQNGRGTQTDPDGRKYIGEFRDNLLNGYGVLMSADGRPIQEGFFQDGKFVRAEKLNSQSSSSLQSNVTGSVTLEDAKRKCSDLGFKSGTEGFGKCVLQLSK
jgi:hypothetical protein